MTRGEEVSIHAWRIAALLDQFQLHVARVRQGNRDMNAVVSLASIAELRDGKLVGIEPWTDTADFDPMLHGALDVAHDDPDLS